MGDPNADHSCCPCVERLRRQNKASSDAWTQRIAKTESHLHHLRSLMKEAAGANRHGGMSAYGQAAIAAAFEVADAAEVERNAYREALMDERRRRIFAEDTLANERRKAERPIHVGSPKEGEDGCS
jgi:hypothetical protein